MPSGQGQPQPNRQGYSSIPYGGFWHGPKPPGSNPNTLGRPKPPTPAPSNNAQYAGLGAYMGSEAQYGWQRGAANVDLTAAANQANFTRRGLDITNEYNQGQYNLGRGSADIRRAELGRQPGLLGDMRRIAQWETIGRAADIDIDNRANERQFGLINAARGDLGANLAREKQRFTDVEAAITQGEKKGMRQERQAQYKMFSNAAASGNVTQFQRMDAKELETNLSENLADFQRERNQLARDSAQADQDYNTRMRELQEQEASAVDARDRNKIRREMVMLEEQRQQRKYQEDLAAVEDERKKNFLTYLGLEVERKKQLGEYQLGKDKVGGDQYKALAQYIVNMQKADADRAAGLATFNATRAASGYTPQQPRWFRPFG